MTRVGENKMNATCKKFVAVTGPFGDFDFQGNECFYWEVMVMDEAENIFGKIYKVFSEKRAIALGEKIGADRGLEVDIDCA